jgi:uncharacterized protein YdaU (DUF1376 family)
VNFYKRHLGDIAKATAHLSQGEMGAYDLLLDWYYSNEKPIPARPGDAYRIARASTKAEKANVDRVLADFFTLDGDGYTQKRVLEEMARANAIADTNRRIAEEREERKRSTKRAREEHEACSNRSTNHQPSQTPDSRLYLKQQLSPPAAFPLNPRDPEAPATDAGRACLLMRAAGCVNTNPSHVDLLAALAEGVSPQTLADTVTEAISESKRQPFTWAISTARGRHADGAKPIPTGESHGLSSSGRSSRESVADRAERFAREGDERDAVRHG